MTTEDLRNKTKLQTEKSSSYYPLACPVLTDIKNWLFVCHFGMQKSGIYKKVHILK